MSASARPYNFDRFDRQHVAEDVERTVRGVGVRPGTAAPDFSLPALVAASTHRRASRPGRRRRRMVARPPVPSIEGVTTPAVPRIQRYFLRLL